MAMVPQHPGLLLAQRSCQRPLLLDVNNKANGPTTSDRSSCWNVSVSARSSTPVRTSFGRHAAASRPGAGLALGAPLLAMDEPLAALDEITRSEMRGLLNQLVEGPGVTTLFVTHSIGEAVALSDRVLVSSPRPARIVADIEIDLPRPRPGDIDDDPRFFELCTQVRHALLEGAGE